MENFGHSTTLIIRKRTCSHESDKGHLYMFKLTIRISQTYRFAALHDN